MYPVLYPVADDTVPIFFDTFDGGTGASITASGLAVTDIEIYKDGSATQRASDNGYALLDTDGLDFDSITGIHGFSIDLSDNSDAGFYTMGPWYTVVVSAITVDGQTLRFVAAMFRIVSATRGLAGTALPDAAADGAGGLPISNGGGLDLDQVATYAGDAAVAAEAAQTRVELALPAAAPDAAGGLAISDAGGLDLDGLQSNVSDILTDTGTTIPGTISTMQANVTDILTDTGTTIPGTISTLQGNVTDMLADTNELQTDLHDGGRLDLILDAAAADALAAKTRAELALPAAAPDAAGGLAISDAGGLDLDQLASDAADAKTAAEAVDPEAIADEVWDEAAAEHVAAGSMGEALGAAGGAADPLLNAVPGAYASGTAGNALGQIPVIAGKTALINGDGTYSANAGLDAAGALVIYQGDDYPAAAPVTLTVSDYDGPSLAGGTTYLRVQKLSGYQGTDDTPDLELTGQSVGIAGDVITDTFVLTDTQTAALEAVAYQRTGNYRFHWVAKTAGGLYRTLLAGPCTVARRIDAAPA